MTTTEKKQKAEEVYLRMKDEEHQANLKRYKLYSKAESEFETQNYQSKMLKKSKKIIDSLGNTQEKVHSRLNKPKLGIKDLADISVDQILMSRGKDLNYSTCATTSETPLADQINISTTAINPSLNFTTSLQQRRHTNKLHKDANDRAQKKKLRPKASSYNPKPLKSSNNILYNRFVEEFDYEINLMSLENSSTFHKSEMVMLMKNTGFIL